MEPRREILKIAVPAVLTNITVPLLGMVDLAIAGHLAFASGSAALLGAIAVGSLIFNMVYWVFNFLRIGTGGLTAQAYGRGDVAAQWRVLRMGLTAGLTGGLLIVALQWPIAVVAHRLIAPSPEVWAMAYAYYRIRVWAAPAVLMLFVANGWFIGMQNSVYPMVLAIVQNLLNILASLVFAFGLDMGIAGVALGTAVSQYLGLALTAWMLLRARRARREAPSPAGGSAAPVRLSWTSFFTLNLDILLRMVLLIAVTCGVTALGARHGDVLLAVNTLLMQLFTIFSYFTDGFAAAGEALSGKYIGRRRPGGLRAVVRGLFMWGGATALLFTVVYLTGGLPLLGLLTDDAAVLDAARAYLPWAVLIPVTSFAAFVWDGVYIGATATRAMLVTIAAGAAAFFAVYFGLPWPSANHRLWLAFVTWLAVRSVVQTLLAPRVLRAAFPPESAC